MKKNFFVLVILALFVMVSCSFEAGFEVEDDTLVSATILPVVSEYKKLEGGVITEDLVPTNYKFRAKPVSKSTVMKGETTGSNWEELKLKPDSTTQYQTACRFSVGQWNFSIRAYNSKNALIYEGSKTVLLTKDGDNTFTVTIAEKINTDANLLGNVKFSVKAPKLVGEKSSELLSLELRKLSDDSIVTCTDYIAPHVTSSTDEYVIFEASGKLKPDMYTVSVAYSDGGVSMSGSVTGFRIVENSMTEIKGSVEESIYASALISSIDTKRVSGTLSDGVFNLQDKEFTFTFSASEGNGFLTPTDYRWYCDGTRVNEGVSISADKMISTFVYSPGSDYGYHCITCIAIYTDLVNSSVYSESKFADYRQN